MTHLRQRLEGALLCLSVLALGLGLSAVHIPLESPAGTMARVLDSLSPHLIAVGFLCAASAALLGARRSGGLMAGAAILAFAVFAWAHAGRSLPLLADRPAALHVLFFNVLGDNRQNADRIVDAVLRADPDVAAFAESAALRGAEPRLMAAYPHRIGCADALCQVTLYAKRPFELISKPGEWFGRYVAVRLAAPDAGPPLTLVIAHKFKPWYADRIDAEDQSFRRLLGQVNGPLLVMGDFNSAAWSAPVAHLLDATGLRAARLPVATWPVEAGALGVPIDNVLVGQGARLTSVRAFGDDLGSNHRGLLVGVVPAS